MEMLDMNGLDQYLVPYIIVQVIAALFLIAAWKNTRLARLLFFLLFLYAAGVNMYTGLTDPDVYLEYADMAVPVYRDFINGWFSGYNHIIIPLIAIGQLCIAIGMLLKGRWVTWACAGAMLFLLAISPLMIGAGFPFTLVVYFAAWIVIQRDSKDYLWHAVHFHRTAVS